jgi:hypothetical protein
MAQYRQHSLGSRRNGINVVCLGLRKYLLKATTMKVSHSEMKRATTAIQENWRNPLWWRNKLMHRVLLPLLFSHNEGIRVLEQRWDNLIILDACRYDSFERVYKEYNLPGRLEYRISRATNTEKFLLENFRSGRKQDDIIYITGNPYVTKLVGDRFFRVVSVWKEAWDEKNKTVLPGSIYKATIKTLEDYPQKRLIIHFIQPHRPFLGLVKEDWAGKLPRHHLLYVYTGHWEEHLSTTNRTTFARLYNRNLDLVIPYVEQLLDVLPGATVVTADHGEALGETIHPLLPISVLGHPRGARIQALVKVPWLITQSNKNRGSLLRLAETRDVPTEEDEGLIRDRLRALGYD